MTKKYTKEMLNDIPVVSVKHKTCENLPRSYYDENIGLFLNRSKDDIIGKITHNAKLFDINSLQSNAWEEEINLLKQQLKGLERGHIAVEYSIPRMGKRIDVVLIIDNYVFLLEFKCGSNTYYASAKEQVEDYALDLHNFHEASHEITLFPILICTNAKNEEYNVKLVNNIANVVCSNGCNLYEIISTIINKKMAVGNVKVDNWINSRYKPTPTIIEAAQALYGGHNVKEISYAEGSLDDIYITTEAVNKVIEQCKRNKEKAICFITGVPGAGKTLVGLNIANQRHNFAEGNDEHAIYLSGNGPLVTVLQEALAQDQNKKIKEICDTCKLSHQNDCDFCPKGLKKSTLSDIRAKTKSFIQIVHTFRDESIVDKINPPIDKIAIFDEAQRAWTKEQLVKFMKDKKGQQNYDMSEPECFIEYLNRHKDWACIICLVGGGQEINVGEAGIEEWFRALNDKYPQWHIYYSDRMTGQEYIGEHKMSDLLNKMQVQPLAISELHLSTSKRSFRSNQVSDFVKALIDGNKEKAKSLYEKIMNNNYPIFLTRDLNKAKLWVKEYARGTERYGIVASSKAKRLRADGVVSIDGQLVSWFLSDKKDVNSSYFMEVSASEFDIQGLEIDYVVFVWEGDYRFENNQFCYYQFKGNAWQKINKIEDKKYLKNAYRVLLTRARQGFIIYVPRGNNEDDTRLPKFYNETYKYLKSIGIEEI